MTPSPLYFRPGLPTCLVTFHVSVPDAEPIVITIYPARDANVTRTLQWANDPNHCWDHESVDDQPDVMQYVGLTFNTPIEFLNWWRKENPMPIQFSDGMVLDPSGPYRAEQHIDGWYVLGHGYIIPVGSYEDALKIIDELERDPRKNEYA